ncbi:TolC family protein [Hyphomonas sp.]|uniref:TolC family protein n=1 Tax=Hyphomonas sp. TaxID=87 RepID=UPI003568B6A3
MSSKFLGLALAMTLSVAHAQAQSDLCESAPDNGEVVSLSQATQRATMADLRPELATAEVRAARTERAIAALRPADTVSLEIEDFPGTGIASNIDSLQVTGSFSRVWERGGKREARETVANTAVDVAQTRFAAVEYAIREEVEILYAEAALAERRVALACDRVALSSDLETAVKKRVDAARDPLLAGARASSDRLQAEADARRNSVQARNLRAALGAYWQAEGDFQIDPNFLNERLEPREVDFSELYAPELDRLEAQRVRSSAQIELERSQAIPDVTWSVGVRKFGIEDDLAVIGGASIPLGSANRSKVSVTRARADQRRIDIERGVLRQQLLRSAVGYQRSAASALDGIEEIDTILLPSATEAVDLARDGYTRGAFSYLDIIDAQRAVAILREERLTHLRTYILNEAALARLTPPVDLPVTQTETPE